MRSLTTLRRSTTLLLTLVLLAFAAACGSDDQPVQSGDGPTDRPDDGGGGAAAEPGGRDDGLFLSIDVSGGFLPMGYDFKTVPRAVVLEDGRTFTGGTIIEIYPGPAVLPVVGGSLAEDELVELIVAAEEAGLLADEPRDYGEPPIADAATTTITVVVDGETHTTSVYALDGSRGGLPGRDDHPGIDEDAVEAREQVAAFVDQVSRTVTESEDGMYEPDRYRVLPLPVPEDGPATDDGIESETREWPFPDVDLVEMQCTALTGEPAEQFGEVIADATEITQWRTPDGALHQLAVRAVLPHEPDCPER